MTDFRALCDELADAYTWCIEECMKAPAEEDTLIQRARAALASEPEPPADGEVAELVNHLLKVAAEDESDGCTYDSALTRRAAELLERLAAEPVPPENGEVAELVEWLHGQDGGIARRAIYSRIADLLSRLAKPVPVGPTQDEIMSLAYEYFTFRGNSHRDSFFATSIEAKKDPCASLDDFARVVLARWGHLALQPVPEGPIDGPAVQSREPASVMEEPSDEAIESWAAASSVPGEFLDPDSGRWERCLSSEEFCATVRAALAFWGQP